MSVDGVSFGSSSQIQQRPPQGTDPEAYAQQYANEHGISIEQAREELKAKFGDPQQQGGVQGVGSSASTATSDALSTGNVDGSGRQPSVPPEAMQLHYAYGIPLEVIQEGDNAIQQYAKENNIQLPEKTAGNSLNIES